MDFSAEFAVVFLVQMLCNSRNLAYKLQTHEHACLRCVPATLQYHAVAGMQARAGRVSTTTGSRSISQHAAQSKSETQHVEALFMAALVADAMRSGANPPASMAAVSSKKSPSQDWRRGKTDNSPCPADDFVDTAVINFLMTDRRESCRRPSDAITD